ncbi:mCG116235, isoform CRA_a [Mus musculus]|nr:mCG116235, isoform CRA_a [Mus musculus]
MEPGKLQVRFVEEFLDSSRDEAECQLQEGTGLLKKKCRKVKHESR